MIMGDKEYESYIEKIMEEEARRVERFIWLEEYFEKVDFEYFIRRIMFEHDKFYVTKCRVKGEESMANNVLGMFFDYLEYIQKPIYEKKITTPFDDVVYEYEGYYFQKINITGSLYRIYDKKMDKILVV